MVLQSDSLIKGKVDEANATPSYPSDSTIMNSLNSLPSESLGTIQYTHALSTKPRDTETTISLRGAQTFRVPRGLLKYSAPQNTSDVAPGARLGDQVVRALTPAAQTQNGLPASSEACSVESSAFTREDLLRRSRAKTFFMEAALQRSEGSQLRFWPINE